MDTTQSTKPAPAADITVYDVTMDAIHMFGSGEAALTFMESAAARGHHVQAIRFGKLAFEFNAAA